MKTNISNIENVSTEAYNPRLRIADVGGSALRILNLYSGIGGNRKLWGKNIKVTAVEYDEDTANIYKKLYPNDTVIVDDAMDFLKNNYSKFDFIWASPPCPTHSRLNTTMVGLGRTPNFPDMALYQIIIFLKQWFKGKWVVENVIPYYEPLIPGKKVDRHLWWSNFNIGSFTPSKKPPHETATINQLEKFYKIDLSGFNPQGKNRKLKMLRNMVHPETGEYILNCAIGNLEKYEQVNLFSNVL